MLYSNIYIYTYNLSRYWTLGSKLFFLIILKILFCLFAPSTVVKSIIINIIIGLPHFSFLFQCLSTLSFLLPSYSVFLLSLLSLILGVSFSICIVWYPPSYYFSSNSSWLWVVSLFLFRLQKYLISLRVMYVSITTLGGGGPLGSSCPFGYWQQNSCFCTLARENNGRER